MKKFSFILALLVMAFAARAAEVIPPVPERHFNDYASVTTPAVAKQLDDQLEAFERETSNQIVGVVYPKMQSDSSVDDYCIRVFNAWKVGQKGKNNGAALFVFVADHKTFIVTGYGLEGALPDATCKLIIENEITPRFKAGDFGGGLTDGLQGMMAATRGEYKGTGRTAHDAVVNHGGAPSEWLVILAIFIVLVTIQSFRRQYTTYGSMGRRSGWYLGGGNWGGGGGGWGGGGGGGGGGFSGGGGSSGGGGAGGSW